MVSSEQVNNSGYSWSQIFRLALRYKREIISAHIIAIFATLVSVPTPLLMSLLIDEILLEQPGILVNTVNTVFPTSWQGAIFTVVVITILTILLRLASLGFGVWQMRQFTIIAKNLVFQIRQQLISRLQRVSMVEYETLGSGQVISHLVTDLDTLDQFIRVTISRFLISALSLIGAAVVLLLIHWQLALFILVLYPLVSYASVFLGRRVKVLKKKENEAYSQFQQVLSETLEAIQQIRAYHREPYYLGRVINTADHIKNHAIAYAWQSDAATRFSFSLTLFGFEIFRALSIFMVLFSDLSIGQMVAVMSYLWFMMNPIQEIINIQYNYYSANAALQRINQLFTLSWEPRYPHLKNPFDNQETTDISFNDVCFSYDQQHQVLDHLSLTIKAGEKVAIAGMSGGGKTTLIQVLLGLYPPQSGTISFNQVPVTEIGLDVVRENVITVLQHPALFNDTLRMNLTLGQDLPDERLWHALEIAQLTETVTRFEHGLETLLGQRGIRLSGGQRQRVAIARMILANPKIVILDEATSALDTPTETKLHEALQAFLKDKTTIIIAHRLTTIKQAERILVFEEGQLVELSTYEQLFFEKN